ncbi:hypothetical protein CPPEL_11240 (plasmid) [Corynebacterium pseudopelargi]|uniref:Uncharacterized protein n=2 Tax=Corynebacterium pseudopelargi TaxID=2080757 RepID=A0A3G6IX24_9CORY|nr:hypothetical protein CPPEL_11240 [Corynebacterium pseudopelargi]
MNMIAKRIRDRHFWLPYEEKSKNPDYYVFFWGEVEEVEGGEPERERFAYYLEDAKNVEEVLEWSKRKALGRDFAVMLGIERKSHSGEELTQLILLSGEYTKESEYDGYSLSAKFKKN